MNKNVEIESLVLMNVKTIFLYVHVKNFVILYFVVFLFDNKLHNKTIRIENNLVTQFNIKSITIQENPTYREVESTMEKLNVSASPKYLYHGQSIHRLAHEYYEIIYNKDYTSQMTPQVLKLFVSKFCKNAGFNVTLKNEKPTHCFDFNKLYAFVLSTCNDDKYGWSQFMPIDETKPFDGEITTGSYYIETDNCFPLHCNGCYSDSVIN